MKELTKIYLASHYSRREELCQYGKELQAIGYRVTSRWLNGKHQINSSGQPIGDHGEKLIEGDDESINAEANEMRTSFAREDFEDVRVAAIIINFTEPSRSSASRGGRHVECGIGLAMGKRCIVVGYRENIFHWLPSWAP